MRCYLGPLIAVLIAVTLALILIMVSAEGQAPVLQHSEYDRRLDRLDRAGVEGAYRARIGLLFQNWMTDTGPESKSRAQKGYVNARKVYIEVMTGIDHRDPEGAAEGDWKLQSEHSRPVTLPPLPGEKK